MRMLRQRHGALHNLMQVSALGICCGIAMDARAQMTAFRMDDLDLRDPHVFVNFITCLDITDTPVLGFSINGQLQTSIQNDAASPQDGLLDLSNVFLFDPLDQGVASNTFASGTADCSAPLAGTQCDGFSASTLSGMAGLFSSGSCLVPLAGATHGYSPAIINATAPCFSSPSGTITIDLSGVPLPLQDAQIAATFTARR